MLKYFILLIVVIVIIVPVLRPRPTHAKPLSVCDIGVPGGITQEEANDILQIENYKCICREMNLARGGLLAAGQCVAVAGADECTSNPNKQCCFLSIVTDCPEGCYTPPSTGCPNPQPDPPVGDPMEMVEWAIVGFVSPDAFTAELQLAQ